jgi:hypothetical protein
MAPASRELGGASVVILGSFNPAIFQPAWFGAEGLLAKSEVEGAEIEMIHPELASFSTTWLQLQTTREQFAASSTREPFDQLRDLVLGTFSLLSHTPVRVMGINRDSHFAMPTEDAWNDFGWRYAPRERWEGVLVRPGLRSLSVQDVRPDNHKGYVRVRIEPSIPVRQGVYVQVNDHFEGDVGEQGIEASPFLDILRREWEQSLTRAERIESAIIEGGEGRG